MLKTENRLLCWKSHQIKFVKKFEENKIIGLKDVLFLHVRTLHAWRLAEVLCACSRTGPKCDFYQQTAVM